MTLLLFLFFSHAQAEGFFCRTTACVIPYDSQGIQNGMETCYASTDKKEKTKEVTWKNGQRAGPARCFENGKLRVEVNYKENKLEGLRVDFAADSTGDRYTRYVGGRQVGFVYSVDEKGSISFRGCWRDDHADELAERECATGDYGKYTKSVLAEFHRRKADASALAKAEGARLNGPQTEKYSNGQTKARYTTQEGRRIGLSEEFWDNGKKALEEHYDSQGRLDGTISEWSQEGNLKRTAIYQSGSMVSESAFLDNGRLAFLKVWQGKGFDRAPCVTYFYENGKKRLSECRAPSLGYYQPLDGDYVNWNEDGSEAIRGRYHSGRREGTWKYFDEGRLSQEEFFDKDILVRTIEYRGRTKTTREYFPDGSIKSQKQTEMGGA